MSPMRFTQIPEGLDPIAYLQGTLAGLLVQRDRIVRYDEVVREIVAREAELKEVQGRASAVVSKEKRKR